jgi:hypothetical protein
VSLLLEYIEKHPKETKRLTGIDYEQLQQLFTQAEVRHHQKQVEIESTKFRLNSKGSGCKPKLSLRDQMLLTLVYLSQFHTFQYLGVEFGVSESTAHNIFHYWLNIFTELLPASLLEQVKKNGDSEWVKELLTQYELIVDSAEQPIERPSANEEQKKFFSGKKKTHTRKNQIIVLPQGEDLVDVIAGDPGPKSDIKQFRESLSNFAFEQKFRGDKAYIGEQQMATPQKKRKNQELTPDQKQENKEFSSTRIFVEHTIRLIKLFRIAHERFRLNRRIYEQVIFTVCGLVRLRIGALVLPI